MKKPAKPFVPQTPNEIVLAALQTSLKWLRAALSDEPEDYDNPALTNAIRQVRAAIKVAKTGAQPALPRVIIGIEGGVFCGYSASAPVALDVLDHDEKNALMELAAEPGRATQVELANLADLKALDVERERLPVKGG